MIDAAERINILHLTNNKQFIDDFTRNFSNYLNIHLSDNPYVINDLIDKRNIEIIITDNCSPDSNGLKLLTTLKKDFPHIPVILYNCKSKEELVKEVFLAGASDYFTGDITTIDFKEKFLNSIKILSAKREAEESLFESNEKFRVLLENINDIIYSVDVNGIITYISPGIEKYGMDHKKIIGTNILELIIPQDREQIINDFQRSMSTGEEFITIIRGADSDGCIHWFEELGKVTRDKNGNITGIIGVMRDFTERKMAEEALKNSEQHYRTMINSIDDCIHIIDRDYKIVMYNKAFKKSLKAINLKLNNDKDLFEVFSFLPDKVRQEYEDVFQKGIQIVTEEHTQIDGKDYWTETRKIPIFEDSGRVFRVITIISDHTEKMQYQENLKLMNKQMQALIQAIPDVVYFKDPDGKNLIINKAYEELTGLEGKDIIGKTDDQILPPELAKYCMESDERIKAAGKPVSIEEKTTDRLNQEIIFETTKVPITDENGSITGLVGISRDVTLQKKTEEILIQKNNELDDFAYRVSHDLKSPLTLIRGYLEAIKEDPEILNKYLPVMARQTERLLYFIDNVLRLSRAGRIISRKQSLNPEEMIRKAFEFQKETHKIPCELKISSPLPVITLDPDAMKQVFSNLIENSFKYRDKAKIYVVIEVKGFVEGKSGFLSIRDNGMGIEGRNVENIFNPGVALSRNKGTGFGLAIVKKIVEAHEGTIKAISDGKNNGTEFILKLPR